VSSLAHERAFHAEGRPPRVGLIGPLPPPAGGMATQCEQLHQLLQAEGIDVVLVRSNAPYRPRWIGGIRGVRAVFRLVPYVYAIFNLCYRIDVIHLFANSGWSWHLFAAPAVWIARARRVPVIVNYRGGDAERFLQGASWWVARTLRLADACVVPSEFLQGVLSRFGVRSRIIPNVVDLSRFRPRESAPRTAGPHVIVTRNLEAIYDIETAIRAFALVVRRFPDTRLTIAGEGPERARLTAVAAELGLAGHVRFCGRLARDAMAALYRDADVMLNPSRIDNMPNSILEAYASGVPVVSTDVGGIPYIARGGVTALLVAPGEPSEMADGICRVLLDPELARSLTTHALSEVTRYSWSEVRPAWLQLYRILTGHAEAILG